MSRREDLAREAWQTMSSLVVNHDRKLAVSDELGMSFAKTRALRRLLVEPLTLRQLAEALTADPPYATLLIDDLEERGLVRRTAHPTDRRAKLVQLTPKGRKIAERAEEILYTPPESLAGLSADELAALNEILDRVRPNP